MRKLCLKDTFALARIIRSANIKEELSKFGAEISTRKKAGETLKAEDVGVEIFLTIIGSLSSESVEERIYDFYADLKGVSADEVSKYDFATVKEDITTLIKENDFKSFFQSASSLTSKM